MSLFVVFLLKGTNKKETEREAENERRENERSQNKDEKAFAVDSAPDPKKKKKKSSIKRYLPSTVEKSS